ncbi:hypothetical protein I5588_16280 [Burkholderia multivorans]|uniref:hypothetical protein n=1 Tax=Burkholderia multivorans TaxID=87883 RepID=UPI0019081CBD|nr:hypothetical protein [Burkholderia multivorans]MBJ9656110.1 hypothetical protein [Burkholderia multivorans]
MRTLEGGLNFEVVGKGPIELDCLSKLFPAALARCAALAMAKKLARRRKPTIRNVLYQFRKLITYGASFDSHRNALMRGSTSTQIGPTQAWHDLVHDWAGYISGQEKTDSNKGATIKTLNTALGYLVDAGIAPKITLPAQPKHWRRNHKAKPGLLEQAGGLEGLGKVLERIKTSLGEMHTRLDVAELESLTRIGFTLAEGVEESEDAVISAVTKGTQELLDSVRRVAEQRLCSIMARKRKADEAVKQWGNPHAVELFDELSKIEGRGAAAIKRHAILDKLFPIDNLNESNANWLIIIRERFAGVAPCPKQKGLPKRYELNFLPSVGGTLGADDITSISVPALAACCILYMVDSLSNVCTALELKKNCMQPTDDDRIERVNSVKPRAGFEPIISEFLVNDSSVELSVPQAIHYVQTNTQIIRNALGLTSEDLFVCARRRKDGTTTGYTLTGQALHNWLHLMMGGKRGERPLVTPSSIRVSGLMNRTIASGGDVVATRLHAHHRPGTGVSEGYAKTYPVKLMYEAKVRHFVDYLQNKIVFSHLEMEEAFGLSKAQADEVLAKAERTGLGFSCQSAFSNSKQAPESDERCPDVGEPCLGCSGSVFLIDFQNLVDVLCVRADLLARKDELEVTATAKWETEYLPLLAFAEVIVEKAKRSVHAATFRKAQFHVDELLRNDQLPTFIL